MLDEAGRQAARRGLDAATAGLSTAARAAASKGESIPGLRTVSRGVNKSLDKLEGVGGKAAQGAGKGLLYAGVAVVVVLGMLFMSVAGDNGALTRARRDQGAGLSANQALEKGVGRRVLAEFKKAGGNSGVPWTVIAGLAGAASETGKFSPYDDYDRDPDRRGVRRTSAGMAMSQPGSPGADAAAGSAGGTDRRAVAEAMAKGLGADNEAAVRFLVAWIRHESSDFRNNPMATTMPAPGATLCPGRKSGKVSSHGVKCYPDGQTGIDAGVKTLVSAGKGRYKKALDLLRQGNILNGVVEEALQRGTTDGLKYCAGNCPGYDKHLISAEAEKYRSDPAFYQSRGAGPALDTPIGAVGAGKPVAAVAPSQNTTGALGGAAPPAGSANGAGATVLVVGDSLCDAKVARKPLEDALRTKGFLPVTECKASRPLAAPFPGQNGLQVLQRAVGPSVAYVVVALGTNGYGTPQGTFAGQVDQALALVGKRPTLWVNVALGPGKSAAGVNAAIAAAPQRHPNLRVADWDKVLDRKLLNPVDGIHMGGPGYKARGEFIAEELSRLAGGAGGAAPSGAPVDTANPAGMKVSDFPVVDPPIGGADPTQALGPFLLRPSAVKDSRVDPQALRFTGTTSPRTATDLVTKLLAANARDLRREGWDERADRGAFWAEAVRRLPVGDPRDGACPTGTLPPAATADETRAQVAGEVRRTWACELARSPELYTLAGAAGTDSVYRELVTGRTQVDLLTNEALTVAWAFSRWGSERCDDGAALAGVFPLTKGQFDASVDPALKDKGRCDPMANIQAAVRAFTSKESVVVRDGVRAGAEGGPFAAVAGGWLAMPWALGDQPTREALLRDGPARAWVPTGECVDKVDSWVMAGGGGAPSCDGPRAAVARLAAQRASLLRSQAAEWTDEGRAAREDRAEGSADAASATTTTTVAGGLSEGLPQDRLFPVGQPEPAAAADLVAKADAALESLGVAKDGSTVRPGTDPVVPRLAGTAATVAMPAVAMPAARDDYAKLVVQVAADMGALWPGDRRFVGQDPFAKLAAFTVTTTAGGTAGQLGSSIPYADLFNQAGKDNGLDPRMLAAVASVESNFTQTEDVVRCRTNSTVGAQGIMQFMPGTAAAYGVDPCRPESAIPGAGRLIKDLLKMKKGDLGAALKFYSGGSSTYFSKVSAKWEEFKRQFPDGQLSAVAAVASPGSFAPVPANVSTQNVCTKRVQGITVNCLVADRVDAMLTAAKASGTPLSGGGYRDGKQQIVLRRAHCGSSDYAIYQMRSSQCRPPTARPGASMHERGLAIDFNACSSRGTACHQWLKANAAQFGFYNLPSEPWHWSVNGN